jgi:RES domain-containing protein
VIYLGRPTDSVTIEAYRHLVDDVESMTEDRVRARYLLRAQVDVPDIVDLRDASVRLSLGLNDEDLISDIGDYEKCQNVGHAAHQLNRHGILTPAATGFGETLALFVDRLTVAELPLRLGEPMLWSKLPPDPRKLRLLENEEGTSIA